MNWLGQVVLQVESYGMDTTLKIFKRSISPNTSFFESFAKKPLASMDDFFKWVDKYAMIEDVVWVAFQQVLVTSDQQKLIKLEAQSPRTTSLNKEGESKMDNNINPLGSPRWSSLMSNSFCWELSKFKWSKPIKTNLARRDRKQRCSYCKNMDIPRSSARMCIS